MCLAFCAHRQYVKWSTATTTTAATAPTTATTTATAALDNCKVFSVRVFSWCFFCCLLYEVRRRLPFICLALALRIQCESLGSVWKVFNSQSCCCCCCCALRRCKWLRGVSHVRHHQQKNTKIKTKHTHNKKHSLPSAACCSFSFTQCKLIFQRDSADGDSTRGPPATHWHH